MHFMGESSGALRAAAFAMACPERVDRLVLNAFTYTGRNSPTLAKRAEQLDYFCTHSRRLRDRAMIRSTFTRDHPGTSDPAVAEALADAELAFGEEVPTGTYLDMTASLPVVDPLKVLAPVMIVRGEHDGIASEEDLLDFFGQLPNPDRQFVVLPGAARALVFGYNRHQLWHTVHAFLTMPPRRDRQQLEFRAAGSLHRHVNQALVPPAMRQASWPALSQSSAVQSCQTRPSTRANSDTFAVTKVVPLRRAWAAINRS
jgi:alpha-beta hydrolase superfamily lysophospholipase